MIKFAFGSILKDGVTFTGRRIVEHFKIEQRVKNLDVEMLALSVSLSEQHLQSCRVYPNRRALIANFPHNAVAAVVGVASGDFSSVILETSRPKQLLLIDAWSMAGHPNYGDGGYQGVKERFQNEIESGRVHILRGYSYDKLMELEDRSLDWIYIDVAHDYYSVKNDLNIAFHKVKNGGIISGHDYHRWGRFGKRFGVLEAVNEYCIQNNMTFIGLSLENDLNWSYALKVTH